MSKIFKPIEMVNIKRFFNIHKLILNNIKR